MLYKAEGLYNPKYEKDACGVGFIANIDGKKNNSTIHDALTILEKMDHRGACGSDKNTGDGAGITIQIPHKFFLIECAKKNISLPEKGKYGLAMLFLPKESKKYNFIINLINEASNYIGFEILFKRKVPINKKNIGESSLKNKPRIEQWIIIPTKSDLKESDLQRKLFVLRKYIEKLYFNQTSFKSSKFYILSLSTSTLIYKGQLTSLQLRGFFPDLSNKKIESVFGLVHSRFSTNTFPSWSLAQPFRYIAHNGEINTLQGNINSLKSAESRMRSKLFTDEELNIIKPTINTLQSDSASLDNLIELFVMSGKSLSETLMILIPEAWDKDKQMSEEKKAFYEYYSSIIEPWDGPAAVIYTDGNKIGAVLDRNGLRPIRYTITKDNKLIMASETGVLNIKADNIKKHGNLKSGKIFILDIEKKKIINDSNLKKKICKKYPYKDWLDNYKIELKRLPKPKFKFNRIDNKTLFIYQKVFGFTKEDIDSIISPMAIHGKEPIGSMGNDTPIAILSKKPKHISNYFKQLFAQVTNPPIDPIREKSVMSLISHLGNNSNLLEQKPSDCHNVLIDHPVLDNKSLEKIRSIDTGVFQSKTVQSYFSILKKENSLENSLERICKYAEDAINDNFKILIISDRVLDSTHAPIPSLLACSAIHQHLLKRGLRGRVGIVAEAGDCWEVHHFACLLAFGASAVNPYVTFSTIRNLKETAKIHTDKSINELRKNYIKAINNGLLKVLSKIGISTLKSYMGAQLFEILGINKDVVKKYFTGTTSRIQGLGINDIEKETIKKHDLGYYNNKYKDLNIGGNLSWKRKGEVHAFNPETISLLQHSTRKNCYKTFKKYSSIVNKLNKTSLRSQLSFNIINKSISIDDVEPAKNIYKRFATGAMSFGSISWEAHTNLAIAMNRIGGKSNSGEGGEDEIRYEKNKDGNNLRSSIKQVASGRFGVTINYLKEADEIQIKMAQGAKPGEGGQLPGYKVDDWIAKVRNSTPGVGLISPPPHHDIYSIEDLAQLIFDLKNSNPDAKINVKLVSKAGVGTIAAGVVKAKSDKILISGYDGGTGASPISSIQHAGLPWELGIAETQQTLMKNSLRSRVTLQVDGQLKTGKDIAIAVLLGAEEWGISSAALISQGCIMMRKCHLNICPVGIATQDKKLRERFSGEVEHIISLFKFLTEELREYMALLGFKTINEMVGQTDCLKQDKENTHWKTKNLDLSDVLFKYEKNKSEYYNSNIQDEILSKQMDWKILKNCNKSINNPNISSEYIGKINNTNRAVGTILSHEIAKKHGSTGLPNNTINIKLEGSGGQSFGAFAAKGLSLCIKGNSNDYFGKGLSGATLIIHPDSKSNFNSDKNIIIGNVALYGATSGNCYISGKAGERFAVRNSGANAVVEGVGDNGCEYMTGGKIIILGNVGKNFGAGMSGGLTFIYRENNLKNFNKDTIDIDNLNNEDKTYIKKELKTHFKLTNSSISSFIIDDFENQISDFKKVFPKEYKKVIKEINISKSNG